MNEVIQKEIGQAEKLNEIEEDMKSTFGILKQANKFVTELAKDYYKDKCIVGMSILILLLIITVTVVGIVKKSKTSSAPTTATTATASNSTNTTTTTNATAASQRAWSQLYKDTRLLSGGGRIMYEPVDMIAG